MKMWIAALLAMSFLHADEVEDLRPQNSIAKVETQEESSHEVELHTEAFAVVVENDHDESEVAQILEENEPQLEASSSLGYEVEQETAAALQSEAFNEEKFDEVNPQTEDLAQLAQKPSVTLSEEPKVELTAYDQLAISVEERQKISTLLVTLAENNVFKLLFERKHLERIGQEIRHVHPVRFVGSIFSNPRLVHCLHRIRRSSFKWDSFVDGFGARFREEIGEGNVIPYIPGLAESLNVETKDLQAYVNFQDFEGMLIFLLEKSKQR